MNMKIKTGAFAYSPVSQLFTQKISSTGHLLRGFLLLLFALAWPLSIRPAQAGYIVTLQQVGPNVVATGSGAIDLTGLTVWGLSTRSPAIRPNQVALGGAFIYTGPISSSVDSYRGASGPTSFGSGFFFTSASSGSGDMVGIVNTVFGFGVGSILSVPTGYVSGTALSDMAIYSGNTLATLGVTPGTWGAGANQKFTLKIESAILPAANITNSSTRASVLAGQDAPIAGFIVSGGAKTVVVRGLGPTLTQSGVSNVLADPFISLFDGAGNVLYTNDNWKDTQQTEIQATGLAPPNDLESAILRTLQPGNYTAVLSSKNGFSLPPRTGLVEVYDTNTGALAELTNSSTRGLVGTGQNVIIAGFVTNGSTQVVVRGLGPTLAQFGVSQVLADPVVSLFDGNGDLVSTNNNWKDKQQAEIQATGLAPPNDLEAVIFAPVAAGNYTAILSGNGGGTGIGLVEIYKL